MIFDTLEYDGTERTLAAWRIDMDQCVSRLGNTRTDTFTITIPVEDLFADPAFPVDALIIVRTNRTSANGADDTFSGGSIEFQGRRVRNQEKADGKKQSSTFEFQGPWYDLQRTQYLQTYKGRTTNYNPGEIVLNTTAFPAISSDTLRYISVGDQIQSILQWVLDRFAARGFPAPFQYVGRDLNAGAIDLNVGLGPPSTPDENTDASGFPYNYFVNAGTTIDVDLFKHFLKSDIIRPMSAADCIAKLLDASPRTNVSFDYSTTPPTLYVDNIDNGAAVSLALFNGTDHKSISIERRDDLIPDSVIINYRITDTSGSSSVIDFVPDKFGPNGSNNALDPDDGPNVIVQTLDLQGFNITFANAELDCEPLACIGGTHAAKRAWWASPRGGEEAKLADFRVRFQNELGTATTLPDAKIFYASNGFDSTGAAVTAGQEFTAADYAFFTNRVVRGTVHSWMTIGGGSIPVKSVKVSITAKAAQYAEYDATSTNITPETDTTGGPPSRKLADLHMGTAELTNGVSGPYSTVATSTVGESYIVGAGGIAEYLFNMLSTPQYECSYIKVEAAFSGGVTLRNRVNFTGGRAEWAVMKGQIQSIQKYWGTKETEIRVGVSRHLNAEQLSAFLNMWRDRRTWYNPAVKADNTLLSNGEVDMPKTVGHANTVQGLENSQQGVSTLYTTPPTGSTPGVVAAQINHDTKAIKDILDATTPTPVMPFGTGDTKVMQPRKVQVCLPDGTSASMIVHSTAPFTEP